MNMHLIMVMPVHAATVLWQNSNKKSEPDMPILNWIEFFF